MKVLIISKRFSPAHVAHMIGYANLFMDLGYDIFWYLDDKYYTWPGLMEFGRKVDDVTKIDKIDIVVICNSSPYNFLLARKLKKQGAFVIYIFHEPTLGIHRKGESLFDRVKLFVACCLSLMTVKYATIVSLPSKMALNMYRESFLKWNDNIEYFPLLFNDDFNKYKKNTREYMSFLGAAVSSHNFMGFISFIKYAYINGSHFKYIIASRINIDAVINQDEILKEMIRRDVLKINHGSPIPDETMNAYFCESFCIWNVYADSTQSGVLPRAFMLGTPVLASDVGSFPEYITPGENGEFCTNDMADMLDKVTYIKSNIDIYSNNCRKAFLNTFYYKANMMRMKKILQKYGG